MWLKAQFRGHVSHMQPPTFCGFHALEWPKCMPRPEFWSSAIPMAPSWAHYGPTPWFSRILGYVAQIAIPRALLPGTTPHFLWFSHATVVHTQPWTRVWAPNCPCGPNPTQEFAARARAKISLPHARCAPLACRYRLTIRGKGCRIMLEFGWHVHTRPHRKVVTPGLEWKKIKEYNHEHFCVQKVCLALSLYHMYRYCTISLTPPPPNFVTQLSKVARDGCILLGVGLGYV